MCRSALGRMFGCRVQRDVRRVFEGGRFLRVPRPRICMTCCVARRAPAPSVAGGATHPGPSVRPGPRLLVIGDGQVGRAAPRVPRGVGKVPEPPEKQTGWPRGMTRGPDLRCRSSGVSLATPSRSTRQGSVAASEGGGGWNTEPSTPVFATLVSMHFARRAALRAWLLAGGAGPARRAPPARWSWLTSLSRPRQTSSVRGAPCACFSGLQLPLANLAIASRTPLPAGRKGQVSFPFVSARAWFIDQPG